MYVNCPVIDQRTQVGSDGSPPEDGNMDCVPASLASMASALLGGTPPQNADAYHDQVYGQGYVGMQDPARFVPLLASLGLTLTCYTGDPASLVAHAAACIRDGMPVLFSIPSDWDNNPPHSAYAHMVAGCDTDGATWLTAMNPWGVAADGYSHAAYQTESFAWWQERLATCAYKATWVLAKAGGGSNGMAGIPSGWHDDGTTLTAPNGVGTSGYIRAHILGEAWDPALWPIAPIYGIHGGWKQDFAAATRSIVALESGAVSEEAGPVYVPQAQLAAAEATIAQLQAQIAALKAAPPAPSLTFSAADIAAATVAALAAKLGA